MMNDKNSVYNKKQIDYHGIALIAMFITLLAVTIYYGFRVHQIHNEIDRIMNLIGC